MQLLEHFVREDLNKRAPGHGRAPPLRLVIENYPEGQVEQLDAVNNPGRCRPLEPRQLPFSRVLYIDQDDFKEDPPKQFSASHLGRSPIAVCLHHHLHRRREGSGHRRHHGTSAAPHDPETKSGGAQAQRKVATIHWVSARPMPSTRKYGSMKVSCSRIRKDSLPTRIGRST